MKKQTAGRDAPNEIYSFLRLGSGNISDQA